MYSITSTPADTLYLNECYSAEMILRQLQEI